MKSRIKYPRSEKVYLPGTIYPELRVGMRKVEQVPSTTFAGEEKVITPNPDIYIYDTSVYGEVVYALFALFNQGIAVELPREVFHFAVHFLHCLINGNRTYGNRTVADNPFAGFVDIFSGR